MGQPEDRMTSAEYRALTGQTIQTVRMTAKEYRVLMGLEKPEKAAPRKRQRSDLEVELLNQILLCKLPKPEEEYRFLEDRRYRFDFAYPELQIAIEVQGGIWRKGGHSSGLGITRDCKKVTLAQTHGWLVLLFTPDLIHSGEAVEIIGQVINAKLENRSKELK